jgi:hypothetical protein
MNKRSLTALLDAQEASVVPPTPAPPPSVVSRPAHKAGEVNISAYFPPDVKAALRQVQAKTNKSIKACLSEALTLLFRKYNVPVTMQDE